MDDPYSAEIEKPFDWGELLHVWFYRARNLLKRFWWVLLATVSVAITIQAFLELRRDPVYLSTARLMVSGQIVMPEGQIYREEFNRFYDTQINLMLSGRVRSGAYARMSAMHPEMERRAVQLHAFVQPDTSIFVLQARSTDPEYCRLYLDSAIDEYINFRKEMRSQTSEGAYLAITEELLGLEEQIEQQESRIVDFKKVNNVAFIQERVDSIGSRLVSLNNQLADLRSEYRLLSTLPLEQQLEGAAGGDGGPPPTPDGGGSAIAALSGNPDYIEAKQTVYKLEAELREFSQYLKPKHPKIIQLNMNIERMESRLKAILEQSAKRLEEAKNILKIRIAGKEAEIEQLEAEALEYQARLGDFEQLSSRLNLLKSSYQRLQERLNSIGINTNLEQETMGVLERASPAREQGGDIMSKVIEGLILGLLAGGGILFLIGVVDNRVFTMEDLTNLFDEPILGVIPYERARTQGENLGLLTPEDERHTFAEACRNLRSSLMYRDRESRESHILMVTSAVPSEGKSTIAANLAIALALAKIPVLLIDGDLRRGHLAKTLELKRSPGLAELIQDRLPLEKGVQQTHVPGLDFIATGPYPERPGELLLDGYTGELLAEARRHYQYIILDTAPVLATDDTTSFVGHVDEILFTVRSGYSRVRQIRPAMDRLRIRNQEVTGLVLNYVDSGGPNYYYYKYNDYYRSGRKSTTPPHKVAGV